MSVKLNAVRSRVHAILDPLAKIASVAGRILRRHDGSVSIIFGLAAIPIIIGAGIAVDTGRAYMVKTRLGAALDAAALAVGSHYNQTTTELTTELQNYFYTNYCKLAASGSNINSCADTIVGETSISVQPTTDITAAVVTYQAQATVPMVFMQLAGVANITVSATTQTTKFPGMEVAVVLDNTGSMLCNGPATGPFYSNCNSPAVTSNASCTSLGANPSRICTLIQAANQFVTTLVNAQTGPQQLYMSIVPYVTTVNVGSAFGCTNGATGCSHITSSGGKFTDERGFMMPVILITGNTTNGSTTISSVAMATPGGSVSGSAAIQPGMAIYGPGIPSGTTVSSVSGTSITISQNGTLSYTGAKLVVGPGNPASLPSTASGTLALTSAFIATMAPSSETASASGAGNSLTGTWTSTGTTITSISPNTTGVVTGMFVGSSNTGIPSPDTVSSVNSSSQVTLASHTTVAHSGSPLWVSGVKGSATSGSNSISSIAFFSGTDCTGATASMSSIVPGMMISGNGIPSATYVTAVNAGSSTITLSGNAAASVTNDSLVFTNRGGNTTSGSSTISCVSASSVPSVGTIITGNGIPVNTTVTAAPSTGAQYQAGTGTLTISNNTTATNNTTLHFFNSLTYDTAYNSANPAGSSTTTSWGGCVIEPTSSGENAAGTGVLAVSGNPDTSNPVSGLSWYPFWWHNDSTNNWVTNGVKRQDTTTEIQGAVGADWLQEFGPNQGCPVPILPLTDLTTTAGQNTVANTINSMWPRDAGGTQVHIGMIWGWRVLSPNGPFTANNGHPLDDDTAQSTGWKKIIVLMTDGTEEWPAGDNLTGLGQIADGKIGTTSTSTAVTNLDTRLQTLCNNILASVASNAKSNFMVYTIGLGADGQNNSQLQACAGNGGFYSAATPANLTQVFQNIAKSIVHLRLSK
jgi:Flp pilus assembly protein TadG